MKQIDFYGVGLGASAGGLEALKLFLKEIPPDTGAVFFVVTHLAPSYKSRLHEILALSCNLQLERVDSSVLVRPDVVYVLKEGAMMFMDGDTLKLRPRNETDHPNRAVNIFFASLAQAFGKKAIGIILSGTGRDGVAGANEIKKHGGVVMVQSPQSTPFTGMPLNVIEDDHPIAVNAPEELAGKLVSLLRNGNNPGS